MFNMKRILVPVDFSAESTLALEWAVMLAKTQPNTHITLCHILPYPVPIGPETIAFDYEDALKREEIAAKKKLKYFKTRVPDGIHASSMVCRGSIATEIERLCGERGIDLVVMTTHGRRGLSRLLHGSTTEETARRAPCPVLVLHLNAITREAVGATCEKTGEGWGC